MGDGRRFGVRSSRAGGTAESTSLRKDRHGSADEGTALSLGEEGRRNAQEEQCEGLRDRRQVDREAGRLHARNGREVGGEGREERGQGGQRALGREALALPSYGDCRSIVVDAPPSSCFDAISDVEHVADWQSSVRRADVTERDARGRAAVVEYEIDARVRRVRYRLRQTYRAPHSIRSEYLGGDFRDFSGEWRFVGLPRRRTRVELDLRIDPGRFVPGPVRGLISDAVMRRALTELKAHVEGAPA